MKMLLIIFGVMSTMMFLFGEIKVNGSTDVGIIGRLTASIFSGLVIAIIFGLPLLGIISLF